MKNRRTSIGNQGTPTNSVNINLSNKNINIQLFHYSVICQIHSGFILYLQTIKIFAGKGQFIQNVIR